MRATAGRAWLAASRELFAKRVERGTPTLARSMRAMERGDDGLDRVVQEVGPVFEPVRVAGDGDVLTDDKAPVEVLGMHAIDGIIADQAGPYREILRTEGIPGLLLRAVR